MSSLELGGISAETNHQLAESLTLEQRSGKRRVAVLLLGMAAVAYFWTVEHPSGVLGAFAPTALRPSSSAATSSLGAPFATRASPPVSSVALNPVSAAAAAQPFVFSATRASPPISSVALSDPVSAGDSLAEAELKLHIQKMYQERTGEWFQAPNFQKYFTDDFILIRPSGRTSTRETFEDMFTTGEFKFQSEDLISIEYAKVFAGGNAACATFITHAKFTYQGKQQDDVAKFAGTFEKTPEGWKLVYVMRQTARPATMR